MAVSQGHTAAVYHGDDLEETDGVRMGEVKRTHM